MARLLMAIVVVFLCCHLTKIIVNFYEAVQVILRQPNNGNDDDDDGGGQYSVTSLVTSQCRGAGPRLLTNFASFPNSLPSSPDATSRQLTHRAGVV